MRTIADIGVSVIEVVRETGEYIRCEATKWRQQDVEIKDKNSLVTYVDREAEKRLVTALMKLLPNAGILTEEDTPDRKGEGYRWVIDPLDGTTNYLHHLPIYSISVALMKEERVVLGVVYEINQDECFSAWKGDIARLNGQPIHPVSGVSMEQALFATGFPYDRYEFVDEFIQLFRQILQSSRGIRRYGSAAVDLCYIAAGRFDGYYEIKLNPWDVAAGAYIAQKAGAIVSDFTGKDDYIFGRNIVAANPSIYQELMAIIGSILPVEKCNFAITIPDGDSP